MKWGVNAVVALARGFWNRLTGLIADDSAGVKAVQKLAASPPTSVQLTAGEAETLNRASHLARNAAELWATPGWENTVIPPQVPGPSHPNIEGGDDGKFQHGMLIASPDSIGQEAPIFFSSDRLDIKDLLAQQILDFAESEGWFERYRRGTHSAADFATKLAADIKTGNRAGVIPLWLYERIEGVE